MIISLEEATVDMLIDVDSRQWNLDLVDGIFAPEESTLIKNNPIGKVRSQGLIVLAIDIGRQLFQQVGLQVSKRGG